MFQGSGWRCGVVPGSEGLQLVEGEVEHPEVGVSRQQRHTLVRQAVIGQVELLQCAQALLRLGGRGDALQLIGRRVQVTQAAIGGQPRLEKNDRNASVY